MTQEERIAELEGKVDALKVMMEAVIKLTGAITDQSHSTVNAIGRLARQVNVLAQYKVNTPDMTPEKIREALK